MPELPEVETVRAGLSRLVLNKPIRKITTDRAKSLQASVSELEQFVEGAEIVNVRRRAKLLLLELSSKYTLMVHLKMTGQLVYVAPDFRFGAGHPSDSLRGELPDKSTRVVIEFTNNSHLYFNDQRKFGWMKLVPTIEVENENFMQKVGPEPLEEGFTPEIFYERLQRRKNTTIKAAILDQTVLAGVGNIYADEALWGAKIHPATRVKDILATKIKDLWQEIREVMQLSIEKGGSTNRNYINAEGKKGSYMDFARVFRREGQPCPRHPDALIEKIRVAGRGTHICPVCQELAGD